METSRSNETFKLKLIHKHWFIEAGKKLHRLNFLKGASSVQIEDNVISADGCMYQVQFNSRKEVKVEKIDDIFIDDEPSNEQLSHNTEEEFESSIKDGIHNEKGFCSYDPDLDQEEWISDNDECDAGDQYGQGSDECFSLKYDGTKRQDKYQSKVVLEQGHIPFLKLENKMKTYTDKEHAVSEVNKTKQQNKYQYGTRPAQGRSASLNPVNKNKKHTNDLGHSVSANNETQQQDQYQDETMTQQEPREPDESGNNNRKRVGEGEHLVSENDVIVSIPTKDVASKIKQHCRSDSFFRISYKRFEKLLKMHSFIIVCPITSKLGPNSDSGNNYTDDITYQGSLELNHETLAQSLCDSFESRDASKEGEDFSDSFGSLNASKEKDISGQSFQNGRPGFLSRFFTNKSQHLEPRQPSKPSIVQLFVPIETAKTKDFPNAMKILFNDTSFKCIPFDGIGMLSDRSPLVVVCPISSRFGPDIDCAIDGIKWKKTFVVLLLHSGLESDLPRIPTAYRLAYNEKYKNIVFIDIAYTKDAKLYQCQMNENAKDQLKSFFQDFTTNNKD